jgi:hypothetical protein
VSSGDTLLCTDSRQPPKYGLDYISWLWQYVSMAWTVDYHDAYWDELMAEPDAVQNAVFRLADVLEEIGPQLGRPRCDSLKGSKFSNMKELRFSLPDGEWRIAFAFDPGRRAILLVGGSKSGTSQARFYRQLIRVADERFRDHLESSL